MTWATTRFATGNGIGLISRETVALVLTDDDEVRETLWSMVALDAPMDEILEALTGHGLRNLPPFAIVRTEDGQLLRVVVRGGMSVSVGTADGRVEVESGAARTWVERAIAAADDFEIRTDDPNPVLPFHVLAGAVPCGALQRSVHGEDTHAAMAASGWSSGSVVSSNPSEPTAELQRPDPVDADPVETGAAEPDQLSTGGPDAEHHAADAVIAPPDVPAAGLAALSWEAPEPMVPTAESEDEKDETHGAGGGALDPFDSGATLLPADLDRIAWPSASSAVAATPDVPATPDAPGAPGAPDGAPPTQAPDDGYDFLFGHTVARSVQQAAVERASDESPSDPGMIDLVPPAQSGASGAAPGPSGQLGDHDGRTISRAELARLRAESAMVPSGPTVQARLCLAGHPNPTHLTVCRTCGGAVTSDPPVNVPRPVLGVLRFSNGIVVHLDRPQLIGRSPKVEGQIGGELPNLVKLDDAGQGVSRRHVAVHIENWQVLLEDLNSANGTIIALPGRPARRLVAGEPVALESGAVVDLGGELSMVFEVTR